MGNIISDSAGALKVNNSSGATGGANDNAFVNNMTDIFFELDLYNTGQYYTKDQAKDTKKLGPRREIDYDVADVSFKDYEGAPDIDQNSRHYNSNNKLIDMIGIPYEDISYTNIFDATTKSGQALNATKTLPKIISAEDPYAMNSNHFYNLKRGFCNASNSVPIDIIGVDIPADNIDVKANLGKNAIDDVLTEQRTNYKYSTNMDKDVENCLTWGTTDPAVTGANFYDVDARGVSTPKVNIPMLQNPNQTLNTSDNLNTIASGKNVYGNTLTAECSILLNKTLTNSYVSPKISDYSFVKKNNIPINQNSIKTMGLEYLKSTNSINIFATKSDTGDAIGSVIKDPNNPVYNTLIPTNSQNGFRDQNTGSCSTLEEDLCKYYYYYDINDGIIHNPKFNISTINSSDEVKKLLPNIRFLNQHVPDCRCKNLPNLIKPDNGTIPDNAYWIKQWTSGKCMSTSEYGPDKLVASGEGSAQYNYTSNSYTDSGAIPIYNKDTTINNYAYRRQKDPIKTQTNLGGEVFVYAPGNVRGQISTFNNYTCNINQNINIQGTGGNVLISGLSAACNIRGDDTPKPEENPPTSATTAKVSFISTTNNSTGKQVEVTDLPLSAGDQILTNIRYADTFAYQSSFLNSFQFSLYLHSDPKKKVVMPHLTNNSSVCHGNNSSNAASTAACYPPYLLTIPFIYGPDSDISGVPYQLIMENKPPGTLNPMQPAPGPIINVKEYSMRINNIELKRLRGQYFMYIGIKMNTDDKFDNLKPNGLRAQIILTPFTGANATSIPIGCPGSSATATTSTKGEGELYQKFDNFPSSILEGALLIGDKCVIQPIKYYYSIIINGNPNSTSGRDIGGYTMLYDQLMPKSEQCIVDFSNLASSFNKFSLSYYDYDDNNIEISLLNNDTVKFGATIIISWQFNSFDNSDQNIDLYYDTATTYSASSSSSVKLNSAPISLNGSTAGSINLLSNSFKFICPMNLKSSPIIIYGIVTQTNNNKIASIAIPVNLTSGINYFKNWKIIPSSSISDMTPLTLTSGVLVSIDNYFKQIGTTKYIVYDPGSKTTPPGWYSGNTLVGTKSETNPNATILQNPSQISPVPIISISAIGTSNNLPSTISVLLGSSITLTYTLQNLQFNTDVQVIIGNPSDTTQQVVIYTFPVIATTTIGTSSSKTITFSIFYNKAISNANIYLTSYGSFTSNKIPIIITLPDSSSTIITSGSDPSPYSASIPNAINQLIKIRSSTSNDALINNMNIVYSNVFPDNKYYIMFDNFKSSLNILKTNINLNAINLAIPLQILFGVVGSIRSLSQFTNVDKKFKKTKELESFYGNLMSNKLVEHMSQSAGGTTNELHLDMLQIDLSRSTLNPIVNIQLNYNGYSKVYIQTLQLLFGQNKLDGTKFNVNFNSDNPSPYFQISNLIFIGSLNSKISLLQEIPGLTNVSYSSSILANGNYVLLTTLSYVNGYYSLPETYSSQLATSIKNNTPPPPIKPTPAPPAPGMSWLKILLIIICVIAVISGGAYIYIKYIKKSDTTASEAASSESPTPEAASSESPTPESSEASSESPATKEKLAE